MITLNVLKEFGPITGFRYYSDGLKSGQEFYEELLKSKFEEAIASNSKLKIEMNGVEGYLSSFINEAFRRLGEDFGSANVWGRLIIEYNESPRVIEKIRKAVHNLNVKNESIKI